MCVCRGKFSLQTKEVYLCFCDAGGHDAVGHLTNYCIVGANWGGQFLAAGQVRGARLGSGGRPGRVEYLLHSHGPLTPAWPCGTHWEHSEGGTGRRHNTGARAMSTHKARKVQESRNNFANTQQTTESI